MIDRLSLVANRVQAASRSLFRVPGMSGLPPVYADLLLDPAERFSALCAEALPDSSATADAEPDVRRAASAPPVAASSRSRIRSGNEQPLMDDRNGQIPGNYEAGVTDAPAGELSVAALPAAARRADVRPIRRPQGSRNRETPIINGRHDALAPRNYEPDVPLPPTQPRPATNEQHAAKPIQNGQTLKEDEYEPRTVQPGAPVRWMRQPSDLGRLLSANLARSSPTIEPRSSATTTTPDAAPALPSAAPVAPLETGAPAVARTSKRPATPPADQTFAAAQESPQHAAPDLDAIVDEIDERLRLEFLRLYGTSGGA
jgi:hypothetical protein